MKQFVVLIALLTISVAVSAQTGLFGLSYGDSHQKVTSILVSEELGFTEAEITEGEYIYTPESNIYVDKILCYFNVEGDQLVFWQVFYIDQADEDIEEIVKQSVNGWHETEPVWDDYYECWCWEFEDGKALYLGYDWDYNYVAEYYNESYSELTVFEYW